MNLCIFYKTIVFNIKIIVEIKFEIIKIRELGKKTEHVLWV